MAQTGTDTLRYNKEMPKENKRLVLLDAHAIIHRAYHALPEFTSSSGEPTGALYGLASMLIRIISDLKPDYIAACYDLPQKTFRHEAYDGYKGKRAKTDDALVAQLKESREIFKGFGIPMYDAPGFEADDVLGTIVHKYKKDKKLDIIIASGDMDTMQLVDDKKVQVYTLKKGINDTILYDEEKVLERFGFKPALLPDYKGLRGDPSDNIIGVKGIGEKTAQTLILQFGTIEEIYKKIKKDGQAFKNAGISPRMAEILKENEEEALFSKTLATIRTDAPVDFELPEKTFWQSADRQKIEEVFNRFEFKSLVSRLQNFFTNGNGQTPEGHALRHSRPVLEGQASFVRSENSSEHGLPALEKGEQPDPEKLQETSIALWLINSDLDDPKLEDILQYAHGKSFEEAREVIFKKLKADKLEKVFEEIEKPIIPVVKEMESYGILVDRKYFEKLSREYHKELDALTKKIWKTAGTEFNINSPKQLGEVLFGKMGIKSGKKSAGGALSTKVSVLEELEESNPIITDILSYRELQKLLSTYIDVIPKMAGEDGRLHARFIQNGTTTGRFSSQDPNLQNLPIKSELGRRIRGGFVAPRGSKLAAFDYSQIELRVAAMLSGDKKMTALFRERKDIHQGVASFVFGVPIDQVDAEMRRLAKVINFGIIYGMGVNALRRNMGGNRADAQKFYDNYFNQFSGLRDYLEEVKSFAKKNLYTETLFGRRRYFPSINSRLPFLRNMAERTATNASLQGTAADIIKLAIRFAHEDLAKAGLLAKTHLVLQVHDELVYEIAEDVLKKASEIIKDAMEGVLARSYLRYKTDIPILVHEGAGANLGEVK
ncbi:MAG: polymerase protein [Parcubacteria group bacterium GW2011_GWA1_47_10]|nr:MAG: polymerase protein [Parcubacteria group bacterium GW2011_GWA1_47_10]KKU97549.1 MAG: polymerase protein [Parcubacteria group bacterium GW2011_GWB1_48_6]